MEEKNLKLPESCVILGVKRSKFYQNVKERLMTEPVHVSGRVSVWPEEEVTAVRTARNAGADDAEVRNLVRHLMARRGARWRELQAAIGYEADATNATNTTNTTNK